MTDVDPRFDPVFQRGYDPDRHGTTDRIEPVAERAAPVEVPAFARTAERAAGPTPEPRQPDDGLDREGARNPWRLALLLASLGLLFAAGLFMWWMLGGGLNGQASQSDVLVNVLQNLSYQAPPALLIAGFSGLAMWLGLGALGQRR